MGYYRSGFEVVGVDRKPQPKYPFRMVVADALQPPFDLRAFAAIHASPPCQRYSVLAKMHPERVYPDLLDATRQMLIASGVPWVIENVPGAPMEKHRTLWGNGIILCGSMFGLGVERGELRRHRAFESSIQLRQLPCHHRRVAVGVYGHGGHSGKPRMLYKKEACEAMGIDWMTRDGLTQAIPPAYTQEIGRQLLEAIK